MQGPAGAGTRARTAVVVALFAVVSTFVVVVDGRVASGAPASPADSTPAANTPAAEGVALVRVEGGPRRAHALLHGRHGIATVEPLFGSAYVKVEAPGRSANALVAALQRDPGVVDAEPDYVFRAAEVPDDPWLPQQTFFDRINATESWGLGVPTGLTVAVLDSGVDLNHPDLIGRLLPGRDFVDNDLVPEDEFGHGTAVAGVVGATTDNDEGVTGVSLGAQILPVRVLDENGETFSSVIVNGMNWAVASGAKVLNLSLGGPSGTSALEAAVNSAVASGVVVVAAAGNERAIDPIGAENPNYPARYANAISVGSTNASNALSSFSNLRADLVAPGENILTTGWDPTNSDPSPYEFWSGTSFSAPIVSALAARMLAVTPGRTPAQIESDLRSTAFDLGTAGFDTTFGAGIVDAHLALSPARTGTGDSGDGYEPNQLMGQPADPPSFPLTASFGSKGDVDWYRITPAAGTWQVTATPGSGVDPVLTLFEPDGDTIDDQDLTGAGAVEQVGMSSDGSTPTYVRVTNARAGTGSYTLSLNAGGGGSSGGNLADLPLVGSSIADRSTGVSTSVTFVLTSPVVLKSSSITTNTINAVSSSGGAVRASSVSLDGPGTHVTATFSLASAQDYVLTVRGWRANSSNVPLRNSDPVRFSTAGVPSTPTTTTPTTTTTAPVSAPPAQLPTAPERAGYWMVGRTGDVYAFGNARWFGNASLPAGVTATNIAATPTGNGYWVVASNGAVYSFGDARFLGGSPVLVPGEVMTSISATPDGNGYWLFSNMGRVFAYGGAPHLGDMTGVRLNGGVLGSVVTPTGRGYYMVAADGGIFSFGDAVFHGSMGGTRLNGPVVGLAPDPDGAGYWLVATDGGIFSFAATFRGSMGSVRLNQPMIGMVAYGDGYLMVASDGGIFTFSSKPFAGSLGGNPPAQPIVAVSPLPD